MRLGHCLAVFLALAVAVSASEIPTNINDEISQDSKVEFVQEIADQEAKKEEFKEQLYNDDKILNEFLNEDDLQAESEGSGNCVDRSEVEDKESSSEAS